jgi:hypothetical protein
MKFFVVRFFEIVKELVAIRTSNLANLKFITYLTNLQKGRFQDVTGFLREPLKLWSKWPFGQLKVKFVKNADV